LSFNNGHFSETFIQAAATKINENKRTSDNLAKVYGVEIVITGKPSNMSTLMTPSRRWIKEGPLQLIDPKHGSQKNGIPDTPRCLLIIDCSSNGAMQ